MIDTLFTNVCPEELHENFFKLLNKDWMLITAGQMGHFNTMTASWGSTGILWNKHIAIGFIRPHRYTFEFAEEYKYFTFSFFGEKYRKILNFCGKYSGRDTNKVAQTGLKPLETSRGNILFEQASLVLECRKLYADFLRPENFMDDEIIRKNYPAGDFHKFFIGEIVTCYKRL
jgi:flavin reductase (DIM6/NTAB) family NADH-FMN oxidoreductase RutF